MLARELADACDVPHRYYTLPETPEDVGEVFDRFVTAGEGRIDHVSGYIDGFGVFADLANSNVNGLIRVDEGFGWRPVGSPAAVWEVIGTPTIDDYETLLTSRSLGRARRHFRTDWSNGPGSRLRLGAIGCTTRIEYRSYSAR